MDHFNELQETHPALAEAKIQQIDRMIEFLMQHNGHKMTTLIEELQDEKGELEWVLSISPNIGTNE